MRKPAVDATGLGMAGPGSPLMQRMICYKAPPRDDSRLPQRHNRGNARRKKTARGQGRKRGGGVEARNRSADRQQKQGNNVISGYN